MSAAAPSGAPIAAGSNVASAAPIAVQQEAYDDDSSSTSSKLKEQTPLDVTSVACLIINKMIGTGIYTTPGIVLFLCGNKVTALFLWLCGGIYSYLSIYIYLEYGLAWPYNGGEFFYISKIFPRPPLLFACSFAWVFICFSTSVGNALNFAKYLLLTRNPTPEEWAQKFLACGVVFAISLLLYRTVNIGVYANNGLAFAKVFFLSFLVLGGISGVSRDGHNQELLGLADFTNTRDDVTTVNVVFALFLVLYSYQGWENANYVTSEIKGDASRRKRILKRGALSAITIVTLLYILFNFFLFFLLDFDAITESNTVAAVFAIKAFHGDKHRTETGIYVCIALSACGNLIGVIFTNIRVKRDIAKHKIIPFYRYFSSSSRYDRATWDGLGTPTGGIMLHGLVTCITIAATPFYVIKTAAEGKTYSTEGSTFVVNIYTYAHSILGITLGIGLFFLKERMDDNQTNVADQPSADEPTGDVQEIFTYNFFKNRVWRSIVAVSFILVNLFLVIIPFISTDNPDGSRRRIPTWILPLIVLPMYILGALAAVFIIAFTPKLEFKGSHGRTPDTFVPYNNRKWVMQYAGLKKQTFSEFRERWRSNGEKDKADELRRRFAQPAGVGQQYALGRMQAKAYGGNVYPAGPMPMNGNGRPTQPVGNVTRATG